MDLALRVKVNKYCMLVQLSNNNLFLTFKHQLSQLIHLLRNLPETIQNRKMFTDKYNAEHSFKK